MIRKDLYISNDISELDVNVFDDDPFCNDDDDHSITFDNELYNSAILRNNQYHFSRSKNDSKNLRF